MSLINLAAAAGHVAAQWRRRRRAYDELMSLDDRTLADIGIRRSQIRGVVYGASENRERPATATASGSNRSRPAMHKAA